MSPQYGELRRTSGWDRFVRLEHPCKFQRVSHLGSVSAWHSSIGRQPNFAVLNRGRHLYLAGRPSCWALAHISSYFFIWLTEFMHVVILCWKIVTCQSFSSNFFVILMYFSSSNVICVCACVYVSQWWADIQIFSYELLLHFQISLSYCCMWFSYL